ncbi:MAG TPA: GNAT family N-acetyltransferase [Verrucomicrobiae bacterium]|nr:GNAT family N-acetyltransferase [Verrucomicrobiae bacterium]
MGLQLRSATADDAEVCGKICWQAFTAISKAHNFPPDIPAPEMAIGLLRMIFSHPGFYGVVAELDGRIVGSNVMDQRDAIRGVGPITVDPSAQNRSVGRRLMEAVMTRAEEDKAPGVRLIQAAFHSRSLSLYTKLGFEVREPLACMQGSALGLTFPGYVVRPAALADIDACSRICREVHGHDRAGELRDAIGQGTATVVEHDGRITGYASVMGFFGHSVGESNHELKALIGAASGFAGPGFLLPARNADLFRWCLEKGLRVVQPMTLMSVGLYNEPAAGFIPSIFY